MAVYFVIIFILTDGQKTVLKNLITIASRFCLLVHWYGSFHDFITLISQEKRFFVRYNEDACIDISDRWEIEFIDRNNGRKCNSLQLIKSIIREFPEMRQYVIDYFNAHTPEEDFAKGVLEYTQKQINEDKKKTSDELNSASAEEMDSQSSQI